MTQLFTNNQSTTLASTLSIGATTTTITNTSAFSTPISPDYELLTLTNGTSIEIVKLTSRSGGTLTLERAQEGTSQVNWVAGDKIEARITKGTLENFTQSKLVNVTSGLNAASNSIGTLTARQPSTAYSLNDIRYVLDTGVNYILKCITSGISSAGALTGLVGYTSTISDGTVVWLSTPIASTGYNVSVGNEALSTNGMSVAIGNKAIAASLGAIAIGTNAISDIGVAIGDSAIAKYGSVSLGTYAYSAFESGFNITSLPDASAFPIVALGGAEYQTYTSLIGMLQSDPIDLAGGSTWAASTSYNHGYVVKPVTPNGNQYLRYDTSYNKWKNDNYTPSSSAGSEPIWPTTFGSGVADGGGTWYCMKLDGSYVIGLPTNAYFVVEEIGFIAYDVSAITVQPTISIGTTGNLTKVANAQTTSGLTANYTVWKYVPSNPVMVPDITIKVNTLATGTRLLGRFYFKGYLTRHWV